MRAYPKLALLPLMLAITAGAPPQKPVQTPSAFAPADSPQPVAVVVAAGPLKETLRRLLLAPYAQVTATVLGDPAWDGSATGLQTLQMAHQADLALLDGHTLAAACRAKTIQRLDWAALGRERWLPVAATDCGAGAYLSATVLAWDTEKFAGVAGAAGGDKPGAAPGWADFWDVAKHPGRRGLRRTARGTLEIALLADGVAPGDVYRTLASSDGVDRAFRKLDQLKPYISWWDQPEQPSQLLASAKVLLTSAPSATLPGGPKSHVGMQWSGSLGEVASWALPAGAPHGDGALAAIVVATDMARQAEFARATRLGPAARGAFALLPADARPQSPGAPANSQASLQIDEGFWLDNADKLQARFAAWAGK